MANIRVELQLEDGSFTTGVLRAGQSLKQFKDELQRTHKPFAKLAEAGQDSFRQFKKLDENGGSLLRTMRDVSIVAGGLTLAFRALSGSSSSTLGNIIRVNSEMEKLRYQMAGMSNAADPMREATEQVEALQEMATKTPFSLGAISTAFVKMKTSGLDPANGSLKALTDGLAAFGASDEQLNRVVLGISQVSGKSVLQMEELRQQIGESMPSAMKLMARSMGVSVADLTKAISTGRVEAGAALSKWFEEVERSYGGTGEMMMKTFSGQMARITTELTRLVDGGRIGEAFERLKKLMGEFADTLGTADAQQFFDRVGDGFMYILGVGEKFAKFLWSVREDFLAMTKVVTYSLAAIAGGAAIRGLSRAFNSLRTDILGIGVASDNTSKKVKEALGLAAGASAAQNATAAGAGFSLMGGIFGRGGAAQTTDTATKLTGVLKGGAGAVARMASGFGMLVTIGGRFLSVLGPIGFAVGTLGPLLWEGGKAIYSWVTGAKETTEELKSVERAALDAKRATLESRKTDLEDRLNKTYEAAFMSRFRRVNAPQRQSDYNQALREYNAFMASYDEIRKEHFDESVKLNEKERQERIAAQTKEIEERLDTEAAGLRRAYRSTEDKSYEKLLADTAAARNAGKSGRAELEEYQERRRQSEAEILRASIRSTEAEAERVKKSVEAGETEVEVLDAVIARRVKLEEQLAATGDKQYTIELLLGTESEQKKFERLTRNFQSAEDRVKDLGAELHGASGAVAKLYHQIKRGDFGRIEEADEVTQKLVKSLVDATIAAEAMDKVLKATDKAEAEISRIYENLLEENNKYLAEIAGVDTDDALAFFNFKKDNGLLEGLGLTPEETVAKALEAVTAGIDTSATQFRTLGDTMRDEAFGQNTVDQIDKVAAAISRVQGAVTGLTSTSGALSLGGVLGGGLSGYVGPGRNSAATSFLDILAQSEGTDFNPNPLAKGYNTTLDYDKWTGPLDLVNMTLKEILVVQDRMVQQTKNIYGDSEGRRGSSAMGRYQITGQTLRDAITRMGLDPNAKFDKPMQDAIAMWLADQSVSAGRTIGSRWDGVRKLNTEAAAMEAYNAARTGAGNAYTAELLSGARAAATRLDEVTANANTLEPTVRQNERDALLATSIRELSEELAAMGSADELGDVGTKEQGVRELILAGKLGSGSKDVTAEEYESILSTARKIDAANERIKQNRKDETEILRGQEKLEEQRAEIAERIRTAKAQTADPNYKGLSSDLQKLAQDEKELLDAAERLYGKDSADYRRIQSDFASQRQQIMSAEGAEALRNLTREAVQSEGATGTQNQQRQAAFDRRVAELEALKQEAIRNGADVAEAEKQFNRAVAAERKLLLDDYTGGLRQTLDQMGDLQGNINALSSSWAQGLSDALYGVASGEKGSFEAFGNSIREGIARSITDKASETIMRPFETILAGDGSEGSGIGGIFSKAFSSIGSMDFSGMFKGITTWLQSSLAGVAKMMMGMFNKTATVPVKHTGGIVGHGGGWGRSAPMASFIGAPKFHTGGIVGKGKFRTGLAPSEVPIIAQKGEGVFTPEQMKHLGGSVSSQSVSINSPITVNANGGTPEQNADLAQQVAHQSQEMFRAMIHQELIGQMRPGGIMRKG